MILDGIGLLLFLIPGLIAFAVGFSNDTIYLPGRRRRRRTPRLRAERLCAGLIRPIAEQSEL
ncbi:MAG TPA: hypothetical protein P5341_16175, partial [Hyphomonas sp.]|nr:hypothetical protein [Hyphomonas sp.]